MASRTRLTLKGFKSIESLEDFELRPLNVLIGANGAGKSNLVDFFRMLRAMAGESLSGFLLERGGADGFFFMGPKHTQRILAVLNYVDSGEIYEFELRPTLSGQVMVEACAKWPNLDPAKLPTLAEPGIQVRTMKGGELESVQRAETGKDLVSQAYIIIGDRNKFHFNKIIASWRIFHFQDTTLLAGMRRFQSVRGYDYLREDAENLAPFLLRLRDQNKGSYDFIRDAVRIAAPFFDDFILEPETKGPNEQVWLGWRQKGSDYRFQPWQLSDGLIRFICLATALLQPNPPALIVLDEPELGLHPSAIALLGAMIQSVSTKSQVIVSTQSPMLVDHFEAEDIVVVDRDKGHSIFRRLDAKELADWLTEYSLGELWEKGVLRGGPGSD